jgi:hypothetical protein
MKGNYMTRDRNTSFVEVMGNKFCAFCLSPMTHASGYEDSYYEWKADYCECDKAQEEIRLEDEVKKAKAKLDSHINYSYKHAYRQQDDVFRRWYLDTQITTHSNEIEKLRAKIKEASQKKK